MKIVVLGAGALGCAIGGTLSMAGNEVWLVNRDAQHVDVMNRAGLTMRSGSGAEVADRVVQVKAATHASGIDMASGPVELIIVLVKSFHTREVIESAGAIISQNTVVLSLQNGVGHEDVLAAAVGPQRVMAGKTYVGGVLLAPGHVMAGTQGKETIIGELSGQITPRALRVAEIFNAAGLETTLSQNIRATIWEKLFVNVATGALSGITRLNASSASCQCFSARACSAATSCASRLCSSSGVRGTACIASSRPGASGAGPSATSCVRGANSSPSRGSVSRTRVARG